MLSGIRLGALGISRKFDTSSLHCLNIIFRLNKLVSSAIPFPSWTAITGINTEGAHAIYTYVLFKQVPEGSQSVLDNGSLQQLEMPNFEHSLKGLSFDIERNSAPPKSFLSLAFFIRGLYAAWEYAEPKSDLAQYIESYIYVQVGTTCRSSYFLDIQLLQFNALQNLATIPGTNQYSSSWQGPPVGMFLSWGQLDALEVLRAAVGFDMPSTPNV